MTETTDTTVRPHNAREILTEALDTIRATFWVQSKEFDFALGSWQGDDTYDFTEWAKIDKAFTVPLDDNHFDSATRALRNPDAQGKAKVTGVCSIGALALANVTLYDVPLVTWQSIQERDFATWKAGQALAWTILASEPKRWDENEAGSIIASWNDAEDRTREQVIEAFEKALEHPILDAERVWTPVQTSVYGDYYSLLYFATEAEAQAFLDGDSDLAAKVRLRAYNAGDWSVREHLHDGAMVTT